MTEVANLPQVNAIGSWADAVEQDLTPGLRQRKEVTKDGIRTVTDYIKEDGSSIVQEVITTFKVIQKKVPKAVADRKKWKKFGKSAKDGQGPQVYTTYVAEEVKMQFAQSRANEEEQAQLDTAILNATRPVDAKAHCRYCKANDHWSVNCPYKEYMGQKEEEEENTRIAAGGRYVPPSRDGRGGMMSSGPMSDRREDFTVRVTNLPEDDDNIEEELRFRFGKAGHIDRLYVARDKQTLRIKGFAYITYQTREDAERAIEMSRGFRMGHLIIKVEWAKPSTN